MDGMYRRLLKMVKMKIVEMKMVEMKMVDCGASVRVTTMLETHAEHDRSAFEEDDL